MKVSILDWFFYGLGELFLLGKGLVRLPGNLKFLTIAGLVLSVVLIQLSGFIQIPQRNIVEYNSKGLSSEPKLQILPGNLNAELLKNAAAQSPKLGIKAETAEKFVLTIPKIGLEKNVEANVNPADEADYGSVLARGIAHGLYTRLPDEATIDGNVYLFAHRRNGLQGEKIGFFSRLPELTTGDMAYIDFGGTRYQYRMRRSYVLDDQSIWVYTDRAATPTLTLQTCENGSEQRLIVEFDFAGVVH